MTPSEEKQAYEQMVQKVRTPSAEEKEEATELQKELTKEARAHRDFYLEWSGI